MEDINEQSEVLIARNNETGLVDAVTGQNEDGTPKITDVKSAKLSDLVKFNKGDNPIEAFISNFIRQAQDPSMFGFYKLPEKEYDKIGKPISDMLQNPEKFDEHLNKIKVDTGGLGKKRATEQKKNVTEPVNESVKESVKVSTKPTPVDPAKIDWEGIEKQWGIKRETLEQSGALQQMLYNRKSPQLFMVSPIIGDERMDVQARLSFKCNAEGNYTLAAHVVKHEPQLDVPFKGYQFTDADKEKLLSTGNLGKAVDLTDPNTGETRKCLVSVDHLTNDLVAMPVDKIFIRDHIGKTPLSMQEIGILKNGGTVTGKEIELNNGRKFTSDLQYNADKRDVEFVRSQSLNQGQKNSESGQQQRNSWVDADGNPKRITKWKDSHFSEQQIADYMAGKQIRVAEITDRKGQPCTVFIQFDKEKQRPVTSYKYLAQKDIVGIASESRTQYAVNNQGKTNEATKNISDPLQKGQTAPKNEWQQTQQRKPKGKKL